MIAACMRYCTVSRRVTAAPYSATSRSIRLTPKPCAGRLGRQDRRRQLAVVAGQDQRGRRAAAASSSAGSVALARLVDHHQVEAAVAEQLAVQAGERGAQHRRAVEDALDGLAPPAGGRRRAGRGPPGACRGVLARLAAWPASTCRPGGTGRTPPCAILRACRASACSSTSRSSVCSRSVGQHAGRVAEPHRLARRRRAAVRAGCPRPGCSGRRPAPARRARTAWRISSTTVVVLPVPGRPVDDGHVAWRPARGRPPRAGSR